MAFEPATNLTPGSSANPPGRLRWRAGAALVAAMAALSLLSPRFGAGRPMAEQPVRLCVGIEVFAGLVWLAAVRQIRRSRRTRRDLLWMIAVGVILRGLMLASTPILANDFWRYLWDGAVVAHGHSPYAHAPQEFLDAGEAPSCHLSAFEPIVREGRPVLARINHPRLRTIYPPLSQAAFALAYTISPWSLIAWRMVLLFFDAVTLALLLRLLLGLGLSPLWAAVYWWNPLLIQMSVNAAHMDVLALPFVLGALLLALRGKPVRAIALMSVAAGVKVWPVILLPFLFRPLLSAPRKLAAGASVAVGILALLTWPAIRGVAGSASGFAAYAERWEMNDSLFMALRYGVGVVLGGIGRPGYTPAVARIVALILLAGWVAWLARRPATSAADLAERMLLAVAGLFLLSPTQFPWYSLWMLPLLALRPRLSLMLLTVVLPLYRLRFYFAARGAAGVFDNGIVWLEYAPVWGLLLWEAVGKHRHGHPAPETADNPGKE